MLHVTVIASLVVTLFFSAVTFKIMGDVEEVLPPRMHSAKTCDFQNLKTLSLKKIGAVEN